MEHLENDMDDLFQKAGELYPLKITGSDWDAVAGKLQSEDPGDMQELTGLTGTTSRRRKWLLLLLLIPLGLGIYYFSGNVKQAPQNAISAKASASSADQNKIHSVIPDKREGASATSNNGQLDNNKTPVSHNHQMEAGKKNNAENSGMNKTGSAKTRKLSYADIEGKQVPAKNTLNTPNPLSSSNDRTKSGMNSNNLNKGSKETLGDATNNSVNNASSPLESASKAAIAVVPQAASIQNETGAVNNNTNKTETLKKESTDSSSAKKTTNTSAKQSRGFYVGLFAGPDISTVKFQSVNNLGFSLGALIGYRFNNRLSVETGVTWDKKYYYSNGEYYKKDGMPLPQTTTLDGSCSMFEIPVDIRFDFATKKNHGFFGKAGLSSYLMTSEQYTFNSPLYPYPYEMKNDTLKNNIFSILQISGGYERVINDKTKMRVEPYVKIPLQGIGKGDMPIASFGIYIGITHSFR